MEPQRTAGLHGILNEVNNMVKRFRIVVDGIAHEVEVEELGTAAVSSAPAAPVSAPTPAPAPAPKAAPAPAPAPKAAATAGAVTVPLPGTVLDVCVSVGQQVKAGQVLVIIEAMKMENEVVAPADGTVTAVSVRKGDAVAFGDALVTLQ